MTGCVVPSVQSARRVVHGGQPQVQPHDVDGRDARQDRHIRVPGRKGETMVVEGMSE